MEEACYSGLCLGLAVGGCEKCNNNTDNEPKSDHIRNGSELRERSISLSLGPSSAMSTEEDDREGEEEEEENEEDPMPVDQVAAPGGPNNPRSTDGNSLDGSRKKLMLSKDQLALLEEAFRHHRNLTADKKRQLADRLNLKPRQVEIWFQNRRARSKLKQIESQLVQLRKECERLSNENQRLKKELDELRSFKDQPSSSLVQPPGSNPSTPPLCPSCLKIIEEAEERD